MLNCQLALKIANVIIDKLSKMSSDFALSQSKLDSASRDREMWFQRLDEIKVQLQDSEEKIRKYIYIYCCFVYWQML